jgi:uncharacterized protein YpmB
VIILKGGESKLVTGILQDVIYTVVELEANQNGYTTTSTGASGTILSNVQSEAKFVNAKNNPIGVTEYTVKYEGNGFTGGVAPVDPDKYFGGELVTVFGQGSLVKLGNSFLGWSTRSTVASASFTAGSTFIIHDDVVLYAVWSQNVYTVTYQPGNHGTFVTQVTGGLRYGDQTTAAPTVTGDAGWNFTGWSPTPTATVTGSAVYVAQWAQISTPTPTSSVTPVPTLSSSPSSSLSATPTPTSSPTPTTSSTTAPTVTVPPIESEFRWAVVNLVLSVLGVVLAVLVSVRVLLFKKKENNRSNDGEGKVGEKQKSVNVKAASRGSIYSGQNSGNDGKVEKFTRRRFVWLIATVVLAIVGVVVFLLTEDMSLPMTLMDKWTIVNVIIFFVEVIALALVFKHNKKNEHNDEQ